MDRHIGCSCNQCSKQDFSGLRYKCLRCLDYDLCADCHEKHCASSDHTTDHPMQCILTDKDVELYYGGEDLKQGITVQNFTCPYCGELGFSVSTLIDHTVDKHVRERIPVLCPVCVSAQNIDCDLLIDELTLHLADKHGSLLLPDQPKRSHNMPNSTVAQNKQRIRRLHYQKNEDCLNMQLPDHNRERARSIPPTTRNPMICGSSSGTCEASTNTTLETILLPTRERKRKARAAAKATRVRASENVVDRSRFLLDNLRTDNTATTTITTSNPDPSPEYNNNECLGQERFNRAEFVTELLFSLLRYDFEGPKDEPDPHTNSSKKNEEEN